MRNLLPALSRKEDFAGLDVGDGCVTAARASRDREGRLHVHNAGAVELAPDAPDRELVAAIRSLWNTTRMPTYTVACCVRVRSAAIKPFHFTGISRADIPAAVQLEAEDVMQKNADAFCLDWHLNPRSAQERAADPEPVHEGLFVAVPRDQVDRHLALLRKAGVYPTRIDSAPIAIANLAANLPPTTDDAQTVCIVNLTPHWADMTVLSPGPHVFARSVFSLREPWEGATAYLARNLVDLLEYYAVRLGRDPVDRVLVTGDLAHWDAIRQAVGGLIDIALDRWDPLEGATFAPGCNPGGDTADPNRGARLATCLGLALGRNAHA